VQPLTAQPWDYFGRASTSLAYTGRLTPPRHSLDAWSAARSDGVLSDFIGYVPTFVKTWYEPSNESPTFFAIEGLASFLGVLAIWQLRVDLILPVYFVLCSAIVVALIYRKKMMTLFKLRGATTLDSPQ